jgi:hypothetical protein
MVPGPAAGGRRLAARLDWGLIRGSWGAGRVWCEGCLSRVAARRRVAVGRWGGAASAFAAGGAVWAVWLGRVVGVLGVVDVVKVGGRWLVDRDRPLTGPAVSWGSVGWSWQIDALLAGGLPGAGAPSSRSGSLRTPGDAGRSRGPGVVRARSGLVVDPVSLIASAWPSRMRDCDGGLRPESRCGQTGVHPWPRRRVHGRRCARSVGCSSAGSPARGCVGP